MLLPGRDAEAERQRRILVDSYRSFRPFDDRSLSLVEPLRGFRFVYYAAWIARRWQDPAFPAAFPHFGTDNYHTLNSDDGPSHVITPGLYLGGCVDAELDGQPSAAEAADEDDSHISVVTEGACAVIGDDEDGVRLVQPAVAGYETCVHVTAQSAASQAANLYGWIDFDGDGTWQTGGDEEIFSGTALTTGTHTLNFNVPNSRQIMLQITFRLTADCQKIKKNFYLL
jgi:hypothetical protein